MTWPPAGVTPYYWDTWCCIVHSDCLEVLPQLEAVDVVLTDPPYGVQKASWDLAPAVAWVPLITEKTSILGLIPGIANLLAYPPRVGSLLYRWTLAVHLSNGMTHGAFGYGNWIACLVYTTLTTTLAQQSTDIHRIIVDGWHKPAHPTPKPYRAILWLLSKLPGPVVLDPFMGAGTTLLAAKDLGRRSIGIEISEAYCEIAAKRLRQEVLPLRYQEVTP